MEMTTSEETTVICSFCGKNQKEVEVIVAQSPVYICDECIEICVSMIAENRRKKETTAAIPARDE